LYYDKGDKSRLHKREHTLSDPPTDLNKKVTLLHHFKAYMKENLTKVVKIDKAFLEHQDGNETKNLHFLTKYLRTKNGVLFRLSNHTVQVF
jgi:hypothetical protein